MWLLQKLTYHYDNSYIGYKQALDELNLDYKIIFYNSSNSLEILNADLLDDNDNSKLIDNYFNKGFFAIGSVKLDRLLRHHENYYLKENFELDFNNILNFIPEEYLLNVPKTIGFISDLYPISEEFILRPLNSDKILTGGYYTEGMFYAIKKNAIKNNDKNILNSKFMMTPIKEITTEYRFFIINGEIITYSSYMYKGKVSIYLEIPQRIIDYVNFLLSNFEIPKNTVIDVALMADNSLKIVEFNTLIASGLYNCDPKKIILASEQNTKNN